MFSWVEFVIPIPILLFLIWATYIEGLPRHPTLSKAILAALSVVLLVCIAAVGYAFAVGMARI